VDRCHLAEVNIARLRAPIDSQMLRPFVDALDRVHALAERTPGFVWRQTADEADY
jgi:hypothetical protein